MKRDMFDLSHSKFEMQGRLRAGAACLLLAVAACSSSEPAPVMSSLPSGTLPTTAAPVAPAGAAGIPATTPASGAGRAAPATGAAGSSPTVTAPASGAAGGGSLANAGTSAVPGATAGSSAATGSAGTSAAAAGGPGAMPAAGSGGAAAGSSAGAAGNGAAGTTGAAGAAGGMSAAHEDLGKGDGSDVVLIGDSWMDNTLQIEGTGGGIHYSLNDLSGQRYRNYGLQGVMLLEADTFGPAIPTQWDDAKRANPKIKTVVMTGGGNDVIQGSPTLQASCSSGTDECKQKLLKIGEALDKLWTQMATDGVLDIVYIRYTDNTGTLDPSLQGDKGFPPPTICTSGKVRCHSVPTTDLVAKTDLAADGIHPLKSANDKIAKRIIELMMKEGIRR